MNDVKKKIIINIIKKNLKLKNIIDLSLSVGSIPDWDSMMHVKIFFDLKKKFSKLNVNNAAKVRSVKDWIDLIERIY